MRRINKSPGLLVALLAAGLATASCSDPKKEAIKALEAECLAQQTEITRLLDRNEELSRESLDTAYRVYDLEYGYMQELVDRCYKKVAGSDGQSTQYDPTSQDGIALAMGLGYSKKPINGAKIYFVVGRTFVEGMEGMPMVAILHQDTDYGEKTEQVFTAEQLKKFLGD